MKTISVKLRGVFVKDYYGIKKGTKVIIDKLRHDNCQSGIMCHISNDVKGIGGAKWFDSDWFKFDK